MSCVPCPLIAQSLVGGSEVYGGRFMEVDDRDMCISPCDQKKKNRKNTFSRESQRKGQEAVGVINSPQIQERSHEYDGI